MTSMCSIKNKDLCIFDGNIIKCNNINQDFTLDQQEKIPYIIKIYKKNNFIFIVQIIFFIIIVFFMLIFFN